jgi:hypothetical protein
MLGGESLGEELYLSKIFYDFVGALDKNSYIV